MRTLIDLSRLIIFILFLPLVIIFIGPLLVLAVFRGQQQMGPITLDSSRYDIFGRLGIFMLGLALWLLVWSGLVWFAIAAASPLSFAPIPFISSDASDSVGEPTATITRLAAAPTARLAAPPTESSTREAEVTPDATDTPSPTSTTPSPSRTATQAASPPTSEPSPTPSTTAQTISQAVDVLTPTFQSSSTAVDQQAVVATIEEANRLLQEVITLPNEENLANLATIWQDRALTKAERFATEQYERYHKPFEVQFEFIAPPTIDEQSSPDEVVITSRERWSYGRASNFNQESFEFIYTLIREDGRWVITYYTYRNLPTPTSTATSQNEPVTVTPTPQS